MCNLGYAGVRTCEIVGWLTLKKGLLSMLTLILPRKITPISDSTGVHWTPQHQFSKKGWSQHSDSALKICDIWRRITITCLYHNLSISSKSASWQLSVKSKCYDMRWYTSLFKPSPFHKNFVQHVYTCKGECIPKLSQWPTDYKASGNIKECCERIGARPSPYWVIVVIVDSEPYNYSRTKAFQLCQILNNSLFFSVCSLRRILGKSIWSSYVRFTFADLLTNT